MVNGLGNWDDTDQDDTTSETVDPSSAMDEEVPSLVFATVDQFVQERLAHNYRRTLNVQGGHTWCPEW